MEQFAKIFNDSDTGWDNCDEFFYSIDIDIDIAEANVKPMFDLIEDSGLDQKIN